MPGDRMEVSRGIEAGRQAGSVQQEPACDRDGSLEAALDRGIHHSQAARSSSTNALTSAADP